MFIRRLKIYSTDWGINENEFVNYGSSCGFCPNIQCENKVTSRPPVIIPPLGQHSATLIFFHGMGDQGNGWAEAFKRNMKFIVPNAREISGMTAWFEHQGFDPSADEDMEGLQAVKNYAHHLVDCEIGLGIASTRIFLGGFSQGGPVALYSALSYREPLGGIICLSGFLLPKDSIPTQIRQIPDLNIANCAVPIFIGHGLYDPNVPYSEAVSMANALRRFDPNVNFRVYRMGHINCAAELNEAIQFIRKIAQQA